MYQYEFHLSDYKLREYEILLARRELSGLFPKLEINKIENKVFEVQQNNKLNEETLKRLTFFSKIILKKQVNNCLHKKIIIPNQVLFEKNSLLYKNGMLKQQKIFNDYEHEVKIGKREIRYFTHAFHEYKGRYYPQLCKSLFNYAGLKERELVLDPFCGSGTTLVECYLNNLEGIGIDLNPLAFLITKVKIDSFSIPIDQLNEDIKKTINNIKISFYNNKIAENDNSDIENSLLDEICYKNKDKLEKIYKLDFEYLEKWFPKIILLKVMIFLLEFSKIKNIKTKNLLIISLSEIIKKFSYQDVNQLRIRRRDAVVDIKIFGSFQRIINRNLDILNAYSNNYPYYKELNIYNYLGDARQLKQLIKLNNNSIDAVVTSPPYATALPYIDTDRLSLFLFGLLNQRNEFNKLNIEMIGNREISKKVREDLEKSFFENYSKNNLPKVIQELILKIYDLNINSEVGFRRKNMAALLYKYFSDMSECMTEMFNVLKKNKYCFMVVGSNFTKAGNTEITIPTDDFIGMIGKAIGFKLKEKINLNIQTNYMIHSKNAIKSEAILVFKKS